MSKKTLNTANLERQGAEKLASLVMDLVQGSAALQRRARMELSAAQGPKDVATDLRKRFASLRRSRSFVDWRKQKALVKEPCGILAIIETSVAPHDPNEAFELLWSYLLLASSIHDRTDDSNGAVGDVMSDAVDLIEQLSSRVDVGGEALAERILEAVADAGYGEFDGIIPATSVALGTEGLEHLKRITAEWQSAPPSQEDIEQYQGFGLQSSPEDSIRRNKVLTASVILADIADAQGDVDAYMARYSAEQLTYATIAPDVARRLLDAGRPEEAHDIISRARSADAAKPFRIIDPDLDEVLEACLEQLDRTDDLMAHLWDAFEQTLSTRPLRKYLSRLPDFDDIEAEEKALDLASRHSDLDAALSFLVVWPARDQAAALVLARNEDLDGNHYELLSAAADALETDYPLAATLLRRSMVSDTLDGAKSKRYRHAARHLAECAATDVMIDDYRTFPTHADFVGSLRKKHVRKYGFWQLVDTLN
ncbi:hypothetical protein SAMN05421759_1291 [Roseivivax lentus]|uniref:Uncharacterized protein n=1 Tax=Roseivivax lentus TaxID=633194 RepID=A0A1N7Q5N2_9RHOB|nr:DUF6880 family protein [Roseivivax lentus]SIT18145.1 hypothetical protein SAMN05421759_1291 [Roseivivax lentus]